MLTVDDVRAWIEVNNDDLDAARLSDTSDAVRTMNRIVPNKSKELWDCGCWLEVVLGEHGADAETIRQIQFACGQRSVFGDGFAVTVAYANEYIERGEVSEKPGNELADKINREVFGD